MLSVAQAGLSKYDITHCGSYVFGISWNEWGKQHVFRRLRRHTT